MAGKRPVGRPTLYKPEYCQMLIDHMATGRSYTTFAAKINVVLDTIYNWEEQFPQFLEAKKMAFQKCQEWWENTAMLGMWNGGGKEAANLNTTLWIFNMKCRFPKDYRDVTHHEFNVKDVDALTKKEVIEETKRTLAFLEAEYEDIGESKDAQKQLPPAKK